MLKTFGTLLILAPDRQRAAELAASAETRDYAVTVVRSVDEMVSSLERSTFDGLLIDDASLDNRRSDLVSSLPTLAPQTEVVILESTGDTDRPGGAVHDPTTSSREAASERAFAALAERLDHRRLLAENRRLQWEVDTITDTAAALSGSLDLQDALSGALQGLMCALEATGAAVRIRDAAGRHDTEVVLGPPPVRDVLTGRWAGTSAPGDAASRMRIAAILEYGDEDGERALPLRSAIAGQLVAGAEVVGTLAFASSKTGWFEPRDRRLLAAIARQIVISVQSARLHRTIWQGKREWEQIVDALRDPIAVYNNRGEIIRGNRALAEHLGVPVTALRTLTCRQVGFCGRTETCASCAVTRALSRQNVHDEITLGDGRIFDVTTFPIGVPSSGPSVLQIAKDLTEEIRHARSLQRVSAELTITNERAVSTLSQLKATQAQLVQSEKLSAVGQLVAGVAHELNNPLTSVIGYAQLVEQELRDAGPSARTFEDVAEDVRRIVEESERAARIVRNLLTFARKQAAERVPLDLSDVCTKVLALRQYEFQLRGIDVTTNIPRHLPPVLGDPGQMQQVILNLVLNAERAMYGRPFQRLGLEATFDREAETIELAVSDSGHGINPDDLSRVFDPFFTTRAVNEGSGLGLSICYGIVRDHGGQICAESSQQRGTTVRVTVPARSADPAVTHTEVLVAHADPAERDLITAALSAWGYRTTTAATSREALGTLQHRAPNVAVLDARLIDDETGGWLAGRPVDGPRRSSLVVMGTAVDAADYFNDRTVTLPTAPIELRALRAAMRMTVKECV